MQDVWGELKRGWHEGRWAWYFTLYFLPSLAAALAVAFLLEGQVSAPPSPLGWALTIPALAFSLFWTGLRLGTSSAWGKWCWRHLVAGLMAFLFVRFIRDYVTGRLDPLMERVDEAGRMPEYGLSFNLAGRRFRVYFVLTLSDAGGDDGGGLDLGELREEYQRSRKRRLPRIEPHYWPA